MIWKLHGFTPLQILNTHFSPVFRCSGFFPGHFTGHVHHVLSRTLSSTRRSRSRPVNIRPTPQHTIFFTTKKTLRIPFVSTRGTFFTRFASCVLPCRHTTFGSVGTVRKMLNTMNLFNTFVLCDRLSVRENRRMS